MSNIKVNIAKYFVNVKYIYSELPNGNTIKLIHC